MVGARYGTMPWVHPETTQARAQGWERAALIRPQNMFCSQIVSCAKIAQEMTVQSHPTAVDGNLLYENLQIWSSAEELANLRSGYRWFSYDNRGWT